MPIVVSFGGGVDSTALLAYLYYAGERPDLILMSDTGAEMPHTLAFVANHVQPWLAAIGWPPVEITRWVRQTGAWIPLDDNCLNQNSLPSKAYGLSGCTSKYKQQPLDKYVRQWAQLHGHALPTITRMVGYDANEGRRVQNLVYRQEVGGWVWRAPLHDAGVSREGCKELIRAIGLPVPLKSSCYMCPLLRQGEIIEVRERYPELMAKALAIEDNALATTIQDPVLRKKGLGLRTKKTWRAVLAEYDALRGGHPLSSVEALDSEPDDEMPCACTD